ncbi:MAG: alcohol dehydrogenase catalytic domain-containing protein [Firmicutes bacterium]|nr:alcohol dehydrogenase catalytic domain-containing protein [Bacillota bacterium]
MKAAVMLEPNKMAIQEVPAPKASGNEVVVRVRASGACGSDITIFRGRRAGMKYPHISGHEVAGEVVEVGPNVKRVKMGDRVALEPNIHDGTCPNCKRGLSILCDTKVIVGIDLPGCFSEYVKAPEDYWYKFPDSLSWEEGALIEPATVGVHAVYRSDVKIGDQVCVFGAGPIGILTMMAAKLAGAVVTMVDVVPDRMEAAKGFGAAHASDGQDLPEKYFDNVFEATGQPDAFLSALRITRRGGTIVTVGLGSKPVTFDLTAITRGELNVKGSVACNGYDFQRTIDLIASGQMPVKKMIDTVLPLEETEKGLKMMEDRIALKPIYVL